MTGFLGDGPPPALTKPLPVSTHGVEIDYGKHKGTKFTRLPIGYLKWMIRDRAPLHELARAELDRRGTNTPAIEVSGHAIDRFSERFLWKWIEHREDTGEKIGLWSYLNNLAAEAWRHAHVDPSVEEKDDGFKFRHADIQWVFATQGEWPVVKSVR